MPEHRGRTATGARRGRRKRWPLVVLGLVSLLVLGWFGWTWARDLAVDRTAAEPAATCARGDAVLRVGVSPSVEQPVREAAKRWNADGRIVADHCVEVTVTSVESAPALAGFTGEWSESELGDRPHAWLPESSFWTDRLAAADDALLGTAPESVASSPVVLAAPGPAARAITTTVSVTWADIAVLTADPMGWIRFGRPGWGRITVAMPSPASNPATGLAVQAVLAGVARQSPLTPQILARPDVVDTLAALADAQPAAVPGDTRAALIALGAAESMESAPFSAVPVLEVDLHRRNLATDGRPAAAAPLFEIVAAGPSPAADFPFVSMTAAGPVLVQAGNAFRTFLQEAPQQREFARAGLRTGSTGERPANSRGMTWADVPPATAAADANTTQQLAATWATAVEGGRVVTVLVDVSRTMGGDSGQGRSRLDRVKEALHGYADYTVSGSLGLWRFAGALDRGRPYEELVPTGPVADRRDDLHAAIDSLAPAGPTQVYESVAAAYRSASAGYVATKRNQIVVITDGGSDSAISLAELKSVIREVSRAAKPLPVSFIAIGPDPDRAALRDLARATGGTVSVLADAKGVQAALGQLAAARD
ncbi:substrate-binding domain-containing protein [Actinokineospora sp.]|uniref:substrate-binding domain-containing protein n=1 Tax=Actinokineospora sp. TaxID=1872133 RepID=UPI0040378681